MNLEDNFQKDQDDMSSKLYPQLASPSDADMLSLKGKTLQIYYFLAKSGASHGVREIQRKFDYSSPSIAAYHLTRLLNFNLITKSDDGLYQIKGDPVRLGELKDHVKFAGIFIPRILLYGIYAIISILAAIFLFTQDADKVFWFTFIVSSNLVFLVIVILDARRISSFMKDVDQISN